jgi:serine O-acetyltransferase
MENSVWQGLDEARLRDLFEAHATVEPGPPPAAVHAWVDELLDLLFPQLATARARDFEEFRTRWAGSHARLLQLLDAVRDQVPASPARLVEDFAVELPRLRAVLLEDADAIYAGDPAATDHDEVIRAYPGFRAIAIYRLAHHFHARGVPIVPRVLTEYGHSRTGIDIHPGAVIGPRFCIDHGTGIVIGETTEIGRNVKLYQGVTLGALSVAKDMARTKRHPTVEDDVVIYASTTILGGDTVVGRGSVIGGNVWLLRSVPPHSRVHYAPGTVVEERDDDRSGPVDGEDQPPNARATGTER